jgi:multiple sugar transport system substrate-binding protein
MLGKILKFNDGHSKHAANKGKGVAAGWLIWSIVLLLSFTLLTACGGENAADSPAPEGEETAAETDTAAESAAAADAEPAEAEPITLEWWDMYGDVAALDAAIEAAITEYETENPNVDIVRTPIGANDIRAKIIQATATNTLPDIMIIASPDHQSLADQGALADLSAYTSSWADRAQYFDGVWSSTVYEGTDYGVPFVSNATALFYNVEQLAEAGYTEPPATWEALRTYAQELTEGERFGFCFSAEAGESGTFTFLPFLWQAGGDLTTLGDEASLKALTFINDLVNTDGSVTQAILGYTQGDCYRQFAAGNAAMMINGPWQLPRFEDDGVTFEWKVGPWPSDVETASILGGENFALGAGTNVDAAWEVLDWMTDPEHLKPLIVDVGFPPRADMADDPAWADDPVLSAFASQVAVARPRAYGPNYPQASEQVWTMVQSVLTESATAEEALEQAAPIVKDLLQ